MTARPTPTLPFPAQPESLAPVPSLEGVETLAVVGYRAVRLEFRDAQGIPRMAFEADETVPQEMVDCWRSMMARYGKQLPLRDALRLPILGPRMVP